MKKIFISVLFILLMSAAAMAVFGGSTWLPDGKKLCGNNWYGGYGLADGTGGLHLFVTEGNGDINSPTFWVQYLHFDENGNTLADKAIDSLAPAGWGSLFAGNFNVKPGKTAVIDSQGNLIVAWARTPLSGSSSKEIYVQKFDSSGSPKWNGGNPVLIDIFGNTIANLSEYCIESDLNDGAWISYSYQSNLPIPIPNPYKIV